MRVGVRVGVSPANRVDTKDGSVRVVDQPHQVLRHALQLNLLQLQLRNVLADTHHTNDRALRPATCRRVEEDIDRLAVLGVQRELEVGRLLTAQRILQHLLHRALELGRDEVLDERAADDLLLGVAGDLGGLLVPLVDEAVGVDAKDGRVRRVDQDSELAGHSR